MLSRLQHLTTSSRFFVHLSSILFTFTLLLVSSQVQASEQEQSVGDEAIAEQDFSDIYRPRITNSQWENTVVEEDYYAKPFAVSIFNPQDGQDGQRLWSQSKALFAYGFVVIGMIAMLPEDVSNWDRSNLFGKWGDNVKEGPVWDRDGWELNVIGHGYFGGVYYQVARKSGYRQWDAFIYSALGSTFYWEYGIEAFAEVPSLQDVVVTPVLGWTYGEWAFQTEQEILRDGGTVWGSETLGNISLAILDPIDSLSAGINNLFGHEVFVAGTGYINMRDVPIGTDGEKESQVQLGVSYLIGSGKKKSSVRRSYYNVRTNDPIDTGIVGFSVGAGHVGFDNMRNFDNGGTTNYGLGLYFTRAFSTKLDYFRADTMELGNPDKFRYENYSITSQYYFRTEHDLRPFVSAGFGEMMREKDNDKRTFAYHLGAGLHYKLSQKWAIQADVRGFHSTSDDTIDTAFSTSLVYRFGKGEY